MKIRFFMFAVFLPAAILFLPAGASAEASSVVWCHNFNSNLRYGSRGSEVNALQTVLQMESFLSAKNSSEILKSYFGDATSSAVVQFQEKYSADILAPSGLVTGTGYVGMTTRAKLNEISGCTHKECNSEKKQCLPAKGPGKDQCSKNIDCVSASVTLTSPKGGETWQPGKSYKIRWKTTKIKEIANISITTSDSSDFPAESSKTYSIFGNGTLSPSLGYFSWDIPLDKTFLKYNKITITANPVDANIGPVSGSNESNFSIAAYPVHSECNVEHRCVAVKGAGKDKCSADSDCLEPSLTVTSPKSGDTWLPGQTYKISWQSSGSGGPVWIILVSPITGKMSILNLLQDVSASDGSFSYTVPLPSSASKGFAASMGYSVVMQFKSKPGYNYGISEGFTILDSLSSPYCSQLWGKIQASWSSRCGDSKYDSVADIDKNSSVGLGKDSDFSLFLSNSGSESWCQAKLNDSTNPCSSSQPSQPSITITSPKGGEQWAQNSSHQIEWKAEGISTLKIRLVDQFGTEYSLADGLFGSQSSLLWKVSSTISAGDNFHIKIASEQDSSVYSQSSAFSIIQAPVACSDSDVSSSYPDGKDYFTKGTAVDKFGTYSDLCYSADKKIFEYYCDATLGYSQGEWHSCPNGCSAGACNKTASLAPNSPEQNLLEAMAAALANIAEQVKELFTKK